MKDNKRVNIKNIYYATSVDKNNNINYVIGFLKNGVFTDIKTDDKYICKGKFFESCNKSNPVRLYDFLCYDLIDVNFTYGTRTVKEIIEKDKFIAKTLDEETNTYDYYDTQAIQQTLAIIKPDGVKNATKIIEMIYNEGLKIETYEVRMLDEEILKEHYAHLIDKPFYPELENYMLSGEVIIMILEGVNAVEKLRNLMGPTNSLKATKGTIRGEFGTDITYNAIHGSDSELNAVKEINRFFRQKQKRI